MVFMNAQLMPNGRAWSMGIGMRMGMTDEAPWRGIGIEA